MRVHIVLLGLAPRLSALRILEEKGPPRVGLFVPLKRNVELGLERRETVRSLSAVLFFNGSFSLLLVREEQVNSFVFYHLLHAALGSSVQFF